jgi:DNA ligase D-like protein (predicted 3'-phosphoesterase)
MFSPPMNSGSGTRLAGGAPSARPGRSAARDILEQYRKKRNFKKTSEPQGRFKAPAGRKNPTFVIQRHDASHLHYDLRLEENGVLKSWAIPKTPPEVEGLKRLAVETEDHPLDYQNFEGTIPEGEYGAGRVEIWDKGCYLPLERGPGKRLFTLSGRKLKGTFVLIKLRAGDKRDKNWLFFKTRSKTEGR